MRKLGIEDLTQLELIDGIMGLIYPAMGILVGAIIASKYVKYKRNELLFVGISLAIVTIPYLALGLTFLGIVFFDTPLPDNIYFFMFIGVSAFGTITWMWAMSILLAPNHIKKIIGTFSAIALTYEVFLLYMLITNPSAIIVRISAMDVDVSPLVSLFTLFQLVLVLITMFMFVRDCLKSENARIIWKGRFLLISTILLVLTTIIILTSPTNIGIILFSRSLYIFRLIFSYLGWLLPERVANWLIKEE